MSPASEKSNVFIQVSSFALLPLPTARLISISQIFHGGARKKKEMSAEEEAGICGKAPEDILFFVSTIVQWVEQVRQRFSKTVDYFGCSSREKNQPKQDFAESILGPYLVYETPMYRREKKEKIKGKELWVKMLVVRLISFGPTTQCCIPTLVRLDRRVFFSISSFSILHRIWQTLKYFPPFSFATTLGIPKNYHSVRKKIFP